MYDVIVIGGGASGLMASGMAAKHGAKTLLLEKMHYMARKLRITGKGRCNLTNIAPLPVFIKHIYPNGKFLRNAFSRFFSSELIAFFESIGVATVTERGERVFPLSNDAKTVAFALEKWCKKNGVEIRCKSKVDSLFFENNELKGVKCKGKIITAHRIIIATGGKSYPATGSTGDGYELAESAGHQIVPVRPALVPVVSKGNTAQQLSGLELKNIAVSVFVNQKKVDSAFGEMTFSDNGISGPIILTLSRIMVDALREKKQVQMSIDLKPALDEKKLDNRLLRDIDAKGNEPFVSLLRGLMPGTLIPVCIEQTKIDGQKKNHQITAKERKRLRHWLKHLEFEVIDYRPFEEAIITAGGIPVKEINPKTMQSRLLDNLYFTGEIIDVDADTGGYNLQIAFSTGWIAGNHAGEHCTKT